MTTQHIPDEILHHILSFCLLVSVDDFCLFNAATPDDTAPGNAIRRHAHLLLVSKRFLRIGTPLLYSAVHLSTESHAEGVAQLLRLDEYIGNDMQSLRVERGALGKSLYTILGLTPHLKAFFVDLRGLRPSDSTWAYANALKDGLLNPEALYVTQDAFDTRWTQAYAKVAQLDAYLFWALPQWSSLRAIHFGVYEATDDLMTALQAAPALQELSFGADLLRYWWSPYAEKRLLPPQLKAVWIRGISREDFVAQNEFLEVSARFAGVMQRLRFDGEDSPQD